MTNVVTFIIFTMPPFAIKKQAASDKSEHMGKFTFGSAILTIPSIPESMLVKITQRKNKKTNWKMLSFLQSNCLFIKLIDEKFSKVKSSKMEIATKKHKKNATFKRSNPPPKNSTSSRPLMNPAPTIAPIYKKENFKIEIILFTLYYM